MTRGRPAPGPPRSALAAGSRLPSRLHCREAWWVVAWQPVLPDTVWAPYARFPDFAMGLPLSFNICSGTLCPWPGAGSSPGLPRLRTRLVAFSLLPVYLLTLTGT